MIKQIIKIVVISSFLFSCNNNSDLQKIKICNQIWATKNLNVAVFDNGDAIPEAKTWEEWIKAYKDEKPVWCYYNNDQKNGEIYGKLYNYYAANDSRGLAPKGWHIPSLEEWETLMNNFGGSNVAGLKLKSINGWEINKFMNNKIKKSDNVSGFNALPGGINDGICYRIGEEGNWWTSTVRNENSSYGCTISNRDNSVIGCAYSNRVGLSVRCIKD